jgi:hypothetical protein
MLVQDNAAYHQSGKTEDDNAYYQSGAAANNASYPHGGGERKEDAVYCQMTSCNALLAQQTITPRIAFHAYGNNLSG